MLVRCLYASRVPKNNSGKLFVDILSESRKNNLKHGITGVLISTGDCFIQILEGGRSQVCATYNEIAKDKRHSEVTLLVFEEISQRSFEGWSMGEVNLLQVNPAMLLKYSATTKLDPFALSGSAMLSLLNDLVACGSVINNRAAKS